MAGLAYTGPALAQLPYTRNTAELQRALAGVLATAQRAGEVAHDRDTGADAANALALATGPGDSVMTNMRTPEAAIGLLHYHLDHLFRAAESGSSGQPSTSA